MNNQNISTSLFLLINAHLSESEVITSRTRPAPELPTH